ncbi:MAG TPA: hypothetical protein VFX98_03270 [Longimicrobiaceae bacterium]|nr:hypothetical protein [Longimicrobiaceae bacterium]
MKRSTMRTLRLFPATLALLAAAAFAPAPAFAQDDDDDWVERCRRWNRDSDREVHCEERETRLRPRGELHVDGRQNGGISVKAWDRDEILVRIQIQSTAQTLAAARAQAGDIEVRTGGAEIYAEGPEHSRRAHWSVSYEIFVPAETDLELRTTNGPISLRGTEGEVEATALNGPITVTGGGGHIRGRAQNGPVTARLEGSRWYGAGLDLETTNGPATLVVPAGYNAELETGTVNGPMSLDFPLTVTVQGRVTRRIRTELGRGGAPIRVVTTNGPVTLRRQ